MHRRAIRHPAQALLRGNRGFLPDAAMIPRIARQMWRARRADVKGSEINRMALTEQGTSGVKKHRSIVLSAPLRGQHRCPRFRPRQAFPHGTGQNRMRAQFDEGPHPVLGHAVHRIQKAHRVAHVAHPVIGINPVSVDHSSGRGRDHRNTARLAPDPAQRRTQVVNDRLHRGRVIGHLDVKHAGKCALGSKQRLQAFQHCGIPRKGHAARAVHRCDADLSRMGRNTFCHLGLWQANCQHPPLTSRQRLQPRAVERHGDGLFHRQRTCDMGRSHFAHAVTADHIRRHAKRLPHRRQADLHRKDSRLRNISPVYPREVFCGVKFLQQRPFRSMAGEKRVDFLKLARKDRAPAPQAAAHGPMLLPHA